MPIFENPFDCHRPSRCCFVQHSDGLQRDSLLTSGVYSDQLKVALSDSKAFVSLKRIGEEVLLGPYRKICFPFKTDGHGPKQSLLVF